MGKRRAKRNATGRGHLEEQNQVFDRGREYLTFRFRAFGQTIAKWLTKRQYASQRRDVLTFEDMEKDFYLDAITELIEARYDRGRCTVDMQSQLKKYLGEQDYATLRPILRGECICYRCKYGHRNFVFGRDLLLQKLKSFKETCDIWRAKLSIDTGEVLNYTDSYDDFMTRNVRFLDDAFENDSKAEMLNARLAGECVCEKQNDLKDYRGAENFLQLDPVFADDCECCIDSSNLLEAEEEQHCLGIDEEGISQEADQDEAVEENAEGQHWVPGFEKQTGGDDYGEMFLVDDDCSSEHDDGGSCRGGLTSRMCALPVGGSSGDGWWKAIKDPSARGMDRAGIG